MKQLISVLDRSQNLKHRLHEKEALFYYAFFALMIFSKGIGLDSGDKLYFILSGFAFAFVLCKIVITKYNRRELCLVIFLAMISIVAYSNSGRLSIVLTVFSIIGIKNIEIEKLFKLGMIIYVPSFFATVFLTIIGVMPNALVVHEKAGMEVIRWGMGYSTGNILHVSYFIFVVFIAYYLSKKKRFILGSFALLLLGNIIVFAFSISYTGVIVTTFYLILNGYGLWRKKLCKFEKIACHLFLPVCLMASFVTPFLLAYPMGQKLSHILQARPAFSYYYLTQQSIRLFGGRMQDIPNFWVIMDNGYVFILMTYGIVALLLFCLSYAWFIAKEKDLSKLAIVFSFLLYGVMEQFISNSFMNLSLLFMGSVLFVGDKASNKQENLASVEKKEQQRKGPTFLFLTIGGIVAVGIYFCMASVPDYISVPMDALHYVEAQSVQIQIKNSNNEKDRLKEVMYAYESIVTDDELIAVAINAADMDMVTVEQIKQALEVGLSQNVHNNQVYDTFRVRLLELYHNVSKEEYKRIFINLLEEAQNRTKQLPIVKESMYAERIEKSAGEDRIEHIDVSKYMVEKSGNITMIEYLRGALLALLGGMLVGYLLTGMVGVGKQTKDPDFGKEQGHKNENCN